MKRQFLKDNYPQLLVYRNEALQNVGARFVDQLEAPRSRSFFPKVWRAGTRSSYPGITLGPLKFAAVGPSMIMADEILKGRTKVKVLDVGCAQGRFREYLRVQDENRELEYVGMDISPPEVPFPVFREIGEVPDSNFDLIFMSEVAEHMPADDFAETYLTAFPALLKPTGMAIIGVPNPLTPTVLQRDVTHVQHYPWFDLYAMLRFFFDEVAVTRTHFIHTPKRLLFYPLRRALSYALEIDWCEGLTLVAKCPRSSF